MGEVDRLLLRRPELATMEGGKVGRLEVAMRLALPTPEKAPARSLLEQKNGRQVASPGRVPFGWRGIGDLGNKVFLRCSPPVHFGTVRNQQPGVHGRPEEVVWQRPPIKLDLASSGEHLKGTKLWRLTRRSC